MGDIVKRLRMYSKELCLAADAIESETDDILRVVTYAIGFAAAADEIEKLRAEIAVHNKET